VHTREDEELLGEQLDGWKGTRLPVVPGLPGTGFRVMPPLGVTV
jgi:hypothetical protein